LLDRVKRSAEREKKSLNVCLNVETNFRLRVSNHWQFLESILGVDKVDLVTREGTHPALKDKFLGEAIDVI
jgi:hypothetical protein